MLRIAVPLLIIVATFGVYASAQDPGMPDSAALGNPDCSPIYAEPGGVLFLQLWLNNDEDLTFLNLSWGINGHRGNINPGILYYWPLMGWDGMYDTTGFINPDYPEYHFIHMILSCDALFECDQPLNTDSTWLHVITSRVSILADSVSPGDTIFPILLFEGWATCASPVVIVEPANGVNADELPDKFTISSIYPNPLNSATTIYYTLPEPADVSLTIYDILGQNVESRNIGYQIAGEHSIIWDAAGRNSGIYFARLTASGHSLVRRMTMVK
jgi:hypothetical protein